MTRQRNTPMTRQQINDYATAAIALIIMAVIFWYVSTSQTSTALKKLEKAQSKTNTITKEVKDLATQNKIIVEKNNIYIKQKTDEARTSVPDDIDSLIDLANDIICNSNENRQPDSTDVTDRPENPSHGNTSE